MLILASASPRRRELLAQAGYEFEVRPAHVNEDLRDGEDAIAYATRLAREKAEAAYAAVASDQWSVASGLVVLGADTTVTLDGHILAKPEDAADAARMLRMLSGRTHQVITGVAVVRGSDIIASQVSNSGRPGAPPVTTPRRKRGLDGDRSLAIPPKRQESVAADRLDGAPASALVVEVAAEVTAVKFVTLSDAEIEAYIATGEPMDKAGAYGIQGLAAKWIPRIEGCYFNVVGLPLALVAAMLDGIDCGLAGG